MSSLTRATQEQWDQLNALGSTYLVNAMMRGPLQVYIVDLIDQKTQTPWHSGEGATPQDALKNAIATANVAIRPKTAAELAKDTIALADENAKLREMVEALQATQATSPKRKQSTETT